MINGTSDNLMVHMKLECAGYSLNST